MPGLLSRLKGVDFYRKIPADLTESSLTGAALSLLAGLSICVLLLMEGTAFLTPNTESIMVVDKSAHGDLLRVNFNVSFPALPCEFASLDISDSLGTKRINLTKTVRKLPINDQLERAGHYLYDDRQLEVKYDDPSELNDSRIDYSAPLTPETFQGTLDRYPIVVVNFYAPWCPYCQRLEPTWEAVTQEVHTRYPESDGRLRFAKVDCVAQVDLCRGHQIGGFPSLRIFRKGHDEVTQYGQRDHEAYKGDRTKEALLTFADSLAPSAGQPHHFASRGVTRVAKTPGCALSGFALVKKVPGTLHFLAKSAGHSFDHQTLNMSHVINYLYFGSKPSPRRRKALQRLHPGAWADEWSDKLAKSDFFSANQRATFEHYAQVVLTTIEPHGSPNDAFDAYEYTVQSHTYSTDMVPAAKVSYTLSPIQIVVRQSRKAFYHFMTTLCAIIGGVFTVAGILDGLFHNTVKLAKKVELGKQT